MTDSEHPQVETVAESYGTVDGSGRATDRSSRFRAVGLSLLFAAVAMMGLAWPREQSPISLFQHRRQMNWTDFEGDNSAEAYIDGEKNILDLFLKESQEENMVVDKAYTAARERVVKRLEAELEKHFQEEVQRAVEERHTQKTRSKVQTEIKSVGASISSQLPTVQGLNTLATKIGNLEREVCAGEPCQEVPAILSKERGRWMGKENEYTREIAALQKESQDWQDKANKYLAMLQAAPPPPPRCSGLKEVAGATGNITTGVSESPGAGSAVEDCRWIVRAPKGMSITLQFSNVHIYGSKSRVSIYVGPENVALYKNEDVVNWSSAFYSFTGSAFPLPVQCNSNEVLVIFHAEPKSHGSPEQSGFDMSWTTGQETEALTPAQLTVPTH